MTRPTAVDRTFRISVALKGLDGLLECIGGLVLLVVSPASINHLVKTLVLHDLGENRSDFLARHLLHSAGQLSHSTTFFGAVYLLTHGAAKLVLVVLVLRNKLWAYPWMIALLLAFVVYQCYRMVFVHVSVALVTLTVFDLFVAWLTWPEYRMRRGRGEAPPATTAVSLRTSGAPHTRRRGTLRGLSPLFGNKEAKAA